MIRYRSVVTRKGQVTIPKELRDEIGLAEGEKVEWTRDGNKFILERATGTAQELYGSLRSYVIGPVLTTEEESAAYERSLTEELLKKYQDT